jgi:hypothetical protein
MYFYFLEQSIKNIGKNAQELVEKKIISAEIL